MSFQFDFLSSTDQGSTPSTGQASQQNAHSQERPAKEQPSTTPCEWLPTDQTVYARHLAKPIPLHDVIQLNDKEDATQLGTLWRIRKNTSSNSDLVPGVYEGGLKVWECSLDLCRYLQSSNMKTSGMVLELGCGHGLPGCWVLKKSRMAQGTEDSSFVVFSDFNEYVLQDVTIPNLVWNTILPTHQSVDDDNTLTDWLAQHTALAAGDWNTMSDQLMAGPVPGIPNNTDAEMGKFDLILAAETTYSEAAATDTAHLVVKHLKRTGIALIATKRYYFGVGGGSDAFRQALDKIAPSPNTYKVDLLQEFDNGAGNIRELLRVAAM